MDRKINKEVRQYQESMFWGLTLRQLIFGILALAVAALTYYGLQNRVNSTLLTFISATAAFPFGACGFLQINGLSFGALVKAFIRSQVIRSHPRIFSSQNFLWNLLQEPAVSHKNVGKNRLLAGKKKQKENLNV